MSAAETPRPLNHLGLFEGIGGFSLSIRWMGWKTKAWSEIDPFCQQVLNKNFPEAHGFGDIKKLTYACQKARFAILSQVGTCDIFQKNNGINFHNQTLN